MNNAITGKTDIKLGGKTRTLVCDMNAAELLYAMYGEHWTLWLIERFVGRSVRLLDGKMGRKLEPLPPPDLIRVLFALLASDREDSGSTETEKDLRRIVGLGTYGDVQASVTKAVIASFGIPGEEIEAVANAADAPRGSEPAATHGTGTR
jgi:hypothetical protein